MVITKKQATNGAKVGGAIVGGSLLAGPVIGPMAGGIAGTYATDRSMYATAGIGAGLAALLMGGSGGSGSGGVM